jgi:hypothetical protein
MKQPAAAPAASTVDTARRKVIISWPSARLLLLAGRDYCDGVFLSAEPLPGITSNNRSFVLLSNHFDCATCRHLTGAIAWEPPCLKLLQHFF